MTLLGTCALVSGCCSDRAWTSADSWYHPLEKPVATSTGDNGAWHEVDPEQVHPVVPAQLANAEQFLADTPCAELSRKTASLLAGTSLPDGGEAAWYLLRGVVLTSNGRFSVSTDGPVVVVQYGCLGARPVPMRRQPLIVQLARAPAEVFVECSMAQ